MIDISKLEESDKGRWVQFIKYYGDDAKALGKIKSWNNKYIFVVFQCDREWKNYADYIGEAVDPSRLEFVDKESL